MTWLDRLLIEGPGLHVGPEATDPTLEALCAGLPIDEARALREERAGILEHQAALTRDEAERRAGLSRTPAPHDQARPPPPPHMPMHPPMCL